MTSAINPAAMRWFAGRGISESTVERLAIYSGRRLTNGDSSEVVPDAAGNIIVFPYFDSGRVVAEKYRSANKSFSQRPNPYKTFFNAAAICAKQVVEGGAGLVIVEGEMDCAAVMEAGYDFVVSVPDGAPPARDGRGKLIDVPEDARDVDPENDEKFAYIFNNWESLKRIKKIVIATDNDDPGRRLAAELVRRLGRVRCFFVEWPDDCKDMNDVLVKRGASSVIRMIESAREYPVRGVYRFSDLPDEPDLKPASTGWSVLDDMVMLYHPALLVVTGRAGHGKALALDTPIPTPSGWTTMGELKEGDELFDDSGSVCRVVRATEVMHGRPCFKVTFAKGETIVADAEHLWLTECEKARKSAQSAKFKRGDREELLGHGTDQRHKRTFASVKTTKEIADSVVYNGARKNHHIAVSRPIFIEDVDLPIDPYVLGVWLGDGTSRDAGLTCFDNEILDVLASRGQLVTKQKADGYYNLTALKGRLRSCGLLSNKHVPAAYLRAGIEQRIWLLRGLMDTDGTCMKDRICEFTSTNERLASSVFELVASLGMAPNIITGDATIYGASCGTKYRVTFVSDELEVFTIRRKLERQGVGTPHRCKKHVIVSVEKVDSVPVRCIQVDSHSKLFLCSRSMIPTHNSSWTQQLVANLARLHGWNIAIASFEMRIKPFVSNALMQAFQEKHISEFDDLDSREAEWLIENRFCFISPDAEEDGAHDINWLLSKAETAVIRYGARVLLIDPWNEIEHSRLPSESQAEYTNRAVKDLKAFGRRFDVLVIIVAHPTKSGAAKEPNDLTLYDISDSAAFQNKADFGIVIARLGDPTESNQTGVFVRKVRYQPETGTLGTAELAFDKWRKLFV